MMNNNKTAMVLGATRGIGSAVIEALVRHGWTVRALVRDPVVAASTWVRSENAPQWMGRDAMNRDDVIRAASGCEAIVHAVNPPGYRNWGDLVLPMIDNSIAAARAAGGARIVLPGTIYNFDPAVTPMIHIDSLQRPCTRKGQIRKMLENTLKAAAPAVASLIVRADDFFGPGASSSWFAQAMVKPGQPIRRLVNPGKNVGHSWAYLPDLGKAIARLMSQPAPLRAFERVQFDGYWDNDGSGMPDAIRRADGRDVPELRFPWWLMDLLAPFGGFPREAAEIAQYWQHPVRLANSRLVELIGHQPRTIHDEAVKVTQEALRCCDPATPRSKEQL